MFANKMNRRQFLKTAGALGLGVAASSYIPYNKVLGVGAAQAAEPLEFLGWDFQPNTIKQHLDAFTEQSGIPVNMHIIPNVGYSGALQAKMMGGVHYDVYYNFRYNTSKFYYAGWARDLKDLPDADKILSDMFPSAVPLYIAEDGALICLPYFNAVHVLHYNKAYVEKAGFSGPPKSKQDVYDQCKKIKEMGLAEIPYSAYWIKDFCEEYLMVYLLSEGIKIFDEKYDPVFQDDPATPGVFDWWQALYKDGLTSPTMLTDQVTQVSQVLADGKAAFFTLHHYFLQGIRKANAAQSNNIFLSNWMPGKTGTTFLMGEVIQMSAEPTNLDNAWALAKFYGWKDKNGELRTFKAWAKAAALACPYPAFFEDKEVQEAYGPGYDFPALVDIFKNRSDPVQARNAPWYPDFQVFVGDTIQELLQGKKTGKETSAALADKVVALKKELYG
jgi:multiple sugar transport system substrate-binding protein